MRLAWNNFSFDLSQKTLIMGILNTTPDSFSDGGIFFEKNRAAERALSMVEDGADIIDIGGESSRPGSDPLPLEEEIRRTIPVIESLAAKVSVPISIDTYKSEVARRALDSGASMVNDISAMRFDPLMTDVVKEYRVPVFLMHMQGAPKNMQKNPSYENVVKEICDFLRECIDKAIKSGIREDLIIIDPGIGFGKTFDHNLEILNNLERFHELGKPVLIGPSRKAFLGNILNNAPPQDRLEGTAAAVAVSVIKGANIVRVHDVKEMSRVVRVADAIRREKIS